MTLTTIIESSKLIGENVEDDVSKRGFVVSEEGLEFEVGHFSPDSKKSSHRALVCDIVVGRSFPVEKFNGDKPLPKGYQSFYMQGYIANR